jgi:tRNA (mo5U34)-methyltransferase
LSYLNLLRSDLLSNLGSDNESEQILSAIERSKRGEILEEIALLKEVIPPDRELDFRDGKVIFSSSAYSAEFSRRIKKLIQRLIPWRKGPISVFGEEVDAEWRSDLKYDRLRLQDLTGMTIADVGCGNGYYMFRMLELNPRAVIGFDPTERYLAQYFLLRSLLPEHISSLTFVPRRSDALLEHPNHFDLSLCMGVLYHHPEPEKLISELYSSLKTGGELILETIYTEGESFTPAERYARMKNVYLIPSLPDLERMLQLGGFGEITVLDASELSTEEQRRTPYSPGDSLIDFLDPENPRLTIEGYPRPRRTVVRARK